MGFKCGIVGLPNVGKSTLFNALTETAAAAAANYPFCTIEPNVGEVPVPDTRLDTLAKIAKSAEVIPTRLTFVDIAGLVRGASKGEGLGNQFLAVIREVDAIAYVLRCFEDDDIIHVEGRVDPIADAETIETELMLADLDSLEKRIPTLERRVRGQDKEAKKTLELVERSLVLLREGKPARLAQVSDEERTAFKALNLLTAKPVLYVCNVDEASAATGNAHSRLVEERAKAEGAGCVIISAKIEAELAELSPDERRVYLAELGLAEPGLNRLIREGYKLLGLDHLFHRRPQGGARLDGDRRHPRAAGRGRHPHRFREGLHPRRDHSLRRLRGARRRGRRPRRRQAPPRRQGLRGQGRRRLALQICELSTEWGAALRRSSA